MSSGVAGFVTDSITYPMQSEHKIKTLVIGTLISFASAILIIPGIFIQGYLVRVVRHGANQTGTLPKFDEWGRLAVDGFKMGVAFVVYYFLFIGLLVLGVLVPSFILASGSSSPGATSGAAASTAGTAAGSGGPGLVGLAIALLLVLLAFAALYFGLVGMVSFAASDNLVNAFNPKHLLSVGFSLPFFVAALLGTIVALALTLASGILSIVLVGLLGFFYTQIVFYYILGQGYTAAGGSVASVS